MKRRHILGLAATAVALPAQAQKVPRIGVLFSADPEPTWTMFRKAMAARGYAEGSTVRYQRRVANSDRSDLADLAGELVDAHVDVIVAVLSPAIAAARRRTSTIPIVFNGGAPSTGMVSNIARPEGNLTGVFSPSPGLAGKGLQLLRGVRPNMRSVGLLLNETDPFHIPLQHEAELVASAEGLQSVPALLRSREELPQAMAEMARNRVDAVLVQPSLGLEVAAALARTHRLAAISFRREFVEHGGLLSYGADQSEINRGVAEQVDRILKGAKPADLPVIQAAKIELVVNRRTARTLGFDFPPMFLARVDEVIE
jgi:putative ABC transport system substrate-binding protein